MNKIKENKEVVPLKGLDMHRFGVWWGVRKHE
jgi:hypothetical protein